VEEAQGAVLAHAVAAKGIRLRKAHRLSGEDIAALRQAGIREVVVARLEAGDHDEDEAATRLTEALNFRGIRAGPAGTGRVNLHAEAAGVFRVDMHLIDAFNSVDPSITVATLADFAIVEEGALVATVKIIPFAVPERLILDACRVAEAGEAFSVEPFRAHRVGLIQSRLAGTKESVLDKTARLTELRLARSGSMIVEEQRVGHDTESIAGAMRALAGKAEMLIVFGASAVSDEHDAIPEAIRAAGGRVERTGMPVDPGNLLVLGELDGRPVIGAPGCARSPKENGFDWVLDRLMAGIHVTSTQIAAMGVGGLLMEIPSRPQPREKSGGDISGPVWGVLLAAGRSTRMGGTNKLLAEVDGVPMVRRAAERLLAAPVAGSVCVLGHQADEVRATLKGLDIDFAENPDFASGLSSSLKAGIAALPEEVLGALICLADMPAIESSDLARLVEAFRETDGKAVIRATHEGKRGNPVILPRNLFSSIASISGDTGARHIIESGAVPVVEVEFGAAASLDIDTPADMERMLSEFSPK
jgi:molybdenum cofactor cytidylyltransferase